MTPAQVREVARLLNSLDRVSTADIGSAAACQISAWAEDGRPIVDCRIEGLSAGNVLFDAVRCIRLRLRDLGVEVPE